MKKFSKKKQMSIIVLVALVIVISAVFAAVYSNKSVKNNFIPAQVNVSVIENDEEVGLTNKLPFGNGNTEKRVQIKNSGTVSNSADEYVRVCIFPKFVNSSDEDIEIYIPYTIPEVISGNTFAVGDVTFTLDSDWTKSWKYVGGYFYCKDILSPGDTTPTLLASVSMDSDKLNYYSNMGALLRVSVLADAIQSVGGAIEARWPDSGLTSNDIARPAEDVSAHDISLFSVMTDEVVTPESVQVTEYQLEQARSMVSRIFITDYILDDFQLDITDDSADNNLSVNDESVLAQKDGVDIDAESSENGEDSVE